MLRAPDPPSHQLDRVAAQLHLTPTGTHTPTAGRMPALAAAIPSYIECITIYQEADPAGQLHAQKLAGAKRVAEVRIAERPHRDP